MPSKARGARRMVISDPAAIAGYNAWLQTPEGQQHAKTTTGTAGARGRTTSGGAKANAGRTTGGFQPWAIKRRSFSAQEQQQISDAVGLLSAFPQLGLHNSPENQNLVAQALGYVMFPHRTSGAAG